MMHLGALTLAKIGSKIKLSLPLFVYLMVRLVMAPEDYLSGEIKDEVLWG
jgi:hypothetical protein